LSTTYDELPIRGLVIGVGWTLIIIAAGLQVIAIIR
jgi:hypothetical protein